MSLGRGVGLLTLVGLWLGGIAAGFALWEQYDATPGPAAPAAAADPRPRGRWALAVFVHPQCPCSRAGLAELADVLRAAPEPVDVTVHVVPPRTAAPLEWDASAAPPGAAVRFDDSGAEARRAGATTSGHAVLTDPAGRVVFRGGLTRARGRAGESPGGRAVLAALAGRPGPADAPVFGCPLFDPNDEQGVGR